MKKTILTLSCIFTLFAAKAQLTYEHAYDTGGAATGYFLHLVHFSSHGYMYAMVNPSDQHGMIELYNLNHTLYKQFAIPPQPAGSKVGTNLQVSYISDSLFNTNPNNIEYLVSYFDTNFLPHVRIYDDLGNTIFSRDSVSMGWVTVPFPITEPVYYTPNGYKIILQHSSSYGQKQAYVYGLPGALPCDECSGGNYVSSVEPGPQSNNNGALMDAYPNPAKNSTTIKYQLPEGVNQAQIVFYDLQGKEVKQFTVDRAFTDISVSTSDISAGTYLYVLRCNNGIIGGKKVIIIK